MFKPTDKDIDRAEDEILAERWADLRGWFQESFTEARDIDLAKFRELLMRQEYSLAGKFAANLVEEFCKPDPNDVYIRAMSNCED